MKVNSVTNAWMVLVVEDEPASQTYLTGLLEALNYDVRSAANVAEAKDLLRRQRFAAILMDIGLPDGNGLDLAVDIRQTNNVPIIFVTQSMEDEVRIKALDIGGDHYITKPYNPRELALRLRNLLSRSQPASMSGKKPETISFHNYIIDFDRHSVVNTSGMSIELTRSEFDLLSSLVLAGGRTLTRDQLLHSINPTANYDVYDRTVDVLISRLRRKLNDKSRNSKIIITVPGRGYRLDRSL